MQNRNCCISQINRTKNQWSQVWRKWWKLPSRKWSKQILEMFQMWFAKRQILYCSWGVSKWRWNSHSKSYWLWRGKPNRVKIKQKTKDKSLKEKKKISWKKKKNKKEKDRKSFHYFSICIVFIFILCLLFLFQLKSIEMNFMFQKSSHVFSKKGPHIVVPMFSALPV